MTALNGAHLSDYPADVVLVLTVRDGDVVELWQRESRSADDLAVMLRKIANGFQHGSPRRIT